MSDVVLHHSVQDESEQVSSAELLVALTKQTKSNLLLSTEFSIHELGIESSSDLARIESESNIPPWSESFFASEFGNKYALSFGATVANSLVGFIVCHAVIDEAHIVNFGIAKLFRGCGVGRALMRHLLLTLAQRNFRWITLEVRRSNAIAVSLYESFGFRQASIREGYYPDNLEDALLMTLDMDFFREQNIHPAHSAVA